MFSLRIVQASIRPINRSRTTALSGVVIAGSRPASRSGGVVIVASSSYLVFCNAAPGLKVQFSCAVQGFSLLGRMDVDLFGPRSSHSERGQRGRSTTAG